MRIFAVLFAIAWFVGAMLFAVLTGVAIATGLWPFIPVFAFLAYLCWKTARLCWHQAEELPR